MSNVSFSKQYVNIVSGSNELVVLRERFFRFCMYKHVQCKGKKNYPVEKVTKKFIAVLWKELS